MATPRANAEHDIVLGVPLQSLQRLGVWLAPQRPLSQYIPRTRKLRQRHFPLFPCPTCCSIGAYQIWVALTRAFRPLSPTPAILAIRLWSITRRVRALTSTNGDAGLILLDNFGRGSPGISIQHAWASAKKCFWNALCQRCGGDETGLHLTPLALHEVPQRWTLQTVTVRLWMHLTGDTISPLWPVSVSFIFDDIYVTYQHVGTGGLVTTAATIEHQRHPTQRLQQRFDLLAHLPR
jgi:hypothetical protein